MKPERISRERCTHAYRAERAVGVVDLLDVAESLVRSGPFFYMERPDGAEAMLAVGSAHSIATAGPRRIEDAEAEIDAVASSLGSARPLAEAGAPAPRFVGGFGFGSEMPDTESWREFPSCWIFLPERLWILEAGTCWLVTIEPCAAGGAVPPRACEPRAVGAPPPARGREDQTPDARGEWLARARRASSMVREGALEKIVLSRCHATELPVQRGPERLARRLRDTRPGCYTYWVSGGETDFVGSTPELLVRTSRGHVETQALAGTARRGSSTADDCALAAALGASAKERHEQLAVTRAITDTLGPLTKTLHVAADPAVLTLPEAHHLHTPIVGELRDPRSALELAGLLHPTPAVCGAPSELARTLLETEEPGRGWYTGAVGWLDPDGDGTFAVALRAGLVDRGRIRLWAGAGIVAGSQPDAEYEETEIKMAAMRAAFDEASG